MNVIVLYSTAKGGVCDHNLTVNSNEGKKEKIKSIIQFGQKNKNQFFEYLIHIITYILTFTRNVVL